VTLLGVQIHALPLDRLLMIIERTVLKRERALITYVNVHAANLAYEQPWLRAFFNRCDVVFCDGFGVKWGVQLLGGQLPERFTPPDWLPRLAQLSCQHGFTWFLLGNRPSIAEKAAERLRERYPGLQIAGMQHGYFDKTFGGAENEAVIHAINTTRPDILFVSFGMPLQERWLSENWARLNVNVALTVGALFDYVAGQTPRGPRWMTDHGWEWLARLLIEPRRLWKRYLVGNPLFLWRVLRQRFGLVRFQE
jgi:N-acetylglucosaminyldiphosphoundecaprenol N-acetyl-beta-D-mannosaminyltransferase